MNGRGTTMVGFGAVLVLCIVAATPAGAVVCEGSVAFEDVLNRSLGSGITEAGDRLIRNEQQWCEFWDALHRTMLPRPPCDRSLVDFTREVAVVTALGSRPNTCYGVAVDCVDTGGAGAANLRVFVKDGVPGAGCACGFAIVYPVHVVRVAKPVGTAFFFHDTRVVDCVP